MGLTINHDTLRLQSVPPDELGRYIDQCMTTAYAEARNSYRHELQEGLERIADGLRGGVYRLPLPRLAVFGIGEARKSDVAERMTYVEFTEDQIRAFSCFLTGVKP